MGIEASLPEAETNRCPESSAEAGEYSDTNEVDDVKERPIGVSRAKKRKTDLILQKVALLQSQNRIAGVAERKNVLMEKAVQIQQQKIEAVKEKNLIRLFRLDLNTIQDEEQREFLRLKRRIALAQLRSDALRSVCDTGSSRITESNSDHTELESIATDGAEH
jgi:hypothetical protein